jgi:prepilin peptidase CpaA
VLAAPHNTSLAVLLLLSAAAALTDLRTGLIPNRLLLAGAAVGLSVRLVVEPLLLTVSPLAALGSCLLGAAAAALVPLALYATKGIGGGDVKLLVLLGALAGPAVGVETQVYAFTLGGLFAFGTLAYRGILWRSLASTAGSLIALRRRADSERISFRFGPAIFAGALVCVLAHWRLS